MGKGAKKLPFSTILGWAKNFTSFTWDALKNVGGVFTKTFDWVKKGFNAFSEGIGFLKDGLSKVWGFYKDYVQPVINNVKTFISNFRSFVEDSLDKLTGGLYSLYKDVTELWETFRNEIVTLKGRIADLVDVFDSKLAERISAATDQILKEIDKRVYKIYDILDKKVFSYIDMVEERIEALEVALNTFFRPLKETIDRLDRLIAITTLPEGIFRRDPFISTIKAYEDDVLNTLFIREPLAGPARSIELPEYKEFLPLLDEEVDAFSKWEAPQYKDFFEMIEEEAEKLAEWKTTEREKKVEFDPDSIYEHTIRRIERGEFVAPSVF